MESKKGRAELPQREWLEIEVDLDDSGVVKDARWKAWGCHHLVEAVEKAAKALHNAELATFSWPGFEHWDLLIQESLDRILGKFKIPVDDPETCHCRKIPTAKVDEAIVLGAHTPEKVTAWTSASSGCGTCRPEVQKLINYRLKKSA
jgi:NAD(P)H-nitrite reductase large subunit